MTWLEHNRDGLVGLLASYKTTLMEGETEGVEWGGVRGAQEEGIL